MYPLCLLGAVLTSRALCSLLGLSWSWCAAALEGVRQTFSCGDGCALPDRIALAPLQRRAQQGATAHLAPAPRLRALRATTAQAGPPPPPSAHVERTAQPQARHLLCALLGSSSTLLEVTRWPVVLCAPLVCIAQQLVCALRSALQGPTVRRFPPQPCAPAARFASLASRHQRTARQEPSAPVVRQRAQRALQGITAQKRHVILVAAPATTVPP